MRVGIVGAGGIVKARHIPGLRARSEVEIRAVSNSTRGSAARVAAEFGIPEVVDDWRELVARDDIDVVWIGTPPKLHAPVTIASLEAGKHVFCQARMASTLAEAEQMFAASRAHPELVTMICPPPHGMKHGGYFQRLLAEGFVGEVLHFSFRSFASLWTDPSRPLHYRQSTAESGINALSIGIFLEVFDRWLGAPELLHAQTAIAQAVQDGRAVDVPDIVQVLGRWPGGVRGSLEWSGVAHHPAQEQLEVYGRDGTLVYRFADDVILGARRDDAALSRIDVPAEQVRGWSVEDDFVDAVLHGGTPEPSFATGLRYMTALDAIRRSAASGAAVEVARSGA